MTDPATRAVYNAIMAIVAEERRKENFLLPLCKCEYCGTQHRCGNCPNCGAPGKSQIPTCYNYAY